MNGSTRSEAVLKVHGLSKSYGNLEALTDLSFEVVAGEILGVLGPNGAGKTTAIRVLTSVLAPTRGHFELMGIPHSRSQEIRALIGVLPESNGFPRSLTGREYLVYMGRLYGQSAELAKEKAKELLHLFGLEGAVGTRISTYSRGMRQRLAISRAFINDPDILFLDEPTLGLDPVGQREVLGVVKAAAEMRSASVILSSHLLDIVETICSRVLILHHGQAIAEGTIADIKQQVPLPQVCRIRVPPAVAAKALSLLSAKIGVSAELSSPQAGELEVSLEKGAEPADLNQILLSLVEEEIQIESFERDSIRLSDAFLSMVQEAQL